MVHFINPALAEPSLATGESPACGFRGEVRLWPSGVNSVSLLESRESKAGAGATVPTGDGVSAVARRGLGASGTWPLILPTLSVTAMVRKADALSYSVI